MLLSLFGLPPSFNRRGYLTVWSLLLPIVLSFILNLAVTLGLLAVGLASLFGVALNLLLLGNESLIVISLNFHTQLSFYLLIWQMHRSLDTAYFPQGYFSWCSFDASFHGSNVSGFQSQIPYLASSVFNIEVLWRNDQRCSRHLGLLTFALFLSWLIAEAPCRCLPTASGSLTRSPSSFLDLLQRRCVGVCVQRLGVLARSPLLLLIDYRGALLALAFGV